MSNLANRTIHLMLSVCILSLLPRTAGAKIIYVDDDAMGVNNGSSWANAYRFLQEALADAKDAEKPIEIRVAQGTYRPDQGLIAQPGFDWETATFQLINGVTLKGGFAGVGPQGRDRTSFLSGDLVDGRTSYHVVTGYGVDETAIIEGFTIVDGSADGDEPAQKGGGGMYLVQSSPTVLHCIFERNSAEKGGAICCDSQSHPELSDCSFTGNMASDIGGAIYVSSSSPDIAGCTFTGNWAQKGGAISCDLQSDPNLVDCLFSENGAESSGGAMYNWASNAILANCAFSGNIANYGGAVYNGGAGFLSICADQVEKPTEVAFHPNGSLYVGSAPAEKTLYRISPGCGIVNRIEGPWKGSPTGLDVDDEGVVWVVIDRYYGKKAELWKIVHGEDPEFVGQLMLARPLSLVIDRLGRFCEPGAMLVAFHEPGLPSTARAVIYCVRRDGTWYERYSPDERPKTQPKYTRILDLCFDDVRGSLWFIAGGGLQDSYLLYEWRMRWEEPRHVPLTGRQINGDLMGLAFDKQEQTLVVGLKNERRIIRVSLKGEVLEELDCCVDPRSIAVDAASNMYVSDDVRGAVWKINSAQRGLILTHCALVDNKATGYGGALQNWCADAVLTNCILAGNQSEQGGVTGNTGSRLTVTNCTFYGNRSPNGAAFAFWADENTCPSEAELCNCILWDDLWNDDREIWNDDGSTINITYSDIRGGWQSEGIIDADPLFASPGFWRLNGTRGDLSDDDWVDGDYHLKSKAGRWDPISERWVVDDVTSPCIDAGDPNSSVGDEPEPNGGRINMGAYGGTEEASMSLSDAGNVAYLQ